MSKKQQGCHKGMSHIPHESGRGSIKDNALKAIVTSELFKMRTEKPKKGKGSYNRKQQKGQMLKGVAPFDYLGVNSQAIKH
ncbi:ribosome alternative rescue factor ArfA [Shewanella sp. Isolate11]|uniref:ribosome alternative rescue factor ArfA n=1 Tax=Shewanella sp. Isolate11 TaxID=2908530 RepID=UPI001EFE4893|nr:ribosome alternative rescue factor ArfA [Shewanella sp. Isolate11]MCG9697588.1 ribosome alternative rescue factor ArfA [Shewanella sp. Isolate11]